MQELRAPKTAASQTLGEMRTLSDMARTRYSVLDILRELTALLPERQDIAVTMISIEKSGKINVNLEASSHDTVSKAVKKIGESAWFINVLPGQITTTQKDNRQMRQLSVSFRLASDADTLATRLVGTAVAESVEAVAQGGAPSDDSQRNRGQGRQGNVGGPGGFPQGGFPQGNFPSGGFPQGGFPPGGFSPGGFQPGGRAGNVNVSPGGQNRGATEASSAPVTITTESGDNIVVPPPSGDSGSGEIRVYRIENAEQSR